MTRIYGWCISMWDCNQLLTGGTICIGPQLTKIIQYSIDQPSHIRVESQRSVMSWEFRSNILKKIWHGPCHFSLLIVLQVPPWARKYAICCHCGLREISGCPICRWNHLGRGSTLWICVHWPSSRLLEIWELQRLFLGSSTLILVVWSTVSWSLWSPCDRNGDS